MLAKELITQCFNCINIVDCWGPNREFVTDPINPRNIKITQNNIDIKHLGIDTVHKFHVATTSMYLSAVLPDLDPEAGVDLVNTIIFVTEALTHSSNKAWECPPDKVYVGR